MSWSDIYKLFYYVFQQDPTERETQRELRMQGAGVTAPGAIPNLRAGGEDGSQWGGQQAPIRIRLGDSTDFIDLSSVTNRISRLKEYDRLQNVAEIETALTTFADEACVTGDTVVMTPFGEIEIEKLTEIKKPDERFLVYAWDFDKHDYTLSWAYNPRKVKKSPIVKIILDNGTTFSCTKDHRVLLKDETWVEAGDLKYGDELMPFYRIRPNSHLNPLKTKQFPRIFTFNNGWMHERQFIEEWKLGKSDSKYTRLNKIIRYCHDGLNDGQICAAMNTSAMMVKKWMEKEGFVKKEILHLIKKYSDKRVVVGTVDSHEEVPVYDLSVDEHQNFATDNVILHNCQEDDEGHVFQIKCEDEAIKREATILVRKVLELDNRAWHIAKSLFKNGDYFLEVIIDPQNPKKYGVTKVQPLPADSVYRIETIKGRLIEFQQSKEGPDYQNLARVEVTKASKAELAQATAIRFTPEQIIHMKIGDDRQSFYPYGVSVIEAARGPAHQLRLYEDAMLVYRLSRAPERRVFYIDVGQLPPFKAEAFMERMKDQFRKKKVYSKKGGVGGASAVEERWYAPAMDEDYWIPMRPNANTRIETLPGACLSLNTKIPLLDGRILSLQEIIKEFDNGNQLWAYSCNPKNGKFAPGKISWAGVTRRNTEVVKITLDNGESIVCTPDHKFPIIGKGDIEAQNLEVGESLIPFNIRKKKIRSNNKYLQLYCNELKEWEFVHRLVSRYFNGIKYENEIMLETVKDSQAKLAQTITIRFTPEKIMHMEVGDDRQKFHPYGVSLIEINKSLKHARKESNLYNHKVIKVEKLPYKIDTGTLTIDNKEEIHGYHNFAISSCYVKNSNLSDIDDALFMRNKLFVALNFPKNYLSNDDPQATRLTLSQQDVRFARLVERLQKPIKFGIRDIIFRHLRIKGYPEGLYEDLEVSMTPPSDWRKINRNEATQTMFDRAATLKGSQLMSDFDILTRILEIEDDEAKMIVSRVKAQKLEELKLQIVGSNPELLGINTPEQEGTEIGTQAGGPSPMLGGEQPPAEAQPPVEGESPPMPPEQQQQPATTQLPEPSKEEIEEYDLDIIDYSRDIDHEEIDRGYVD